MSFNSQEISTQDGNLTTLYLLEWGETQWRYTSADRPIQREEEVGGDIVTVTYEPRAVKDNGMVQGSSSQNDFTLDGPSDLPIVRLFRGSPPSATIWLTVRRIHDDPQDAPIYWKGTVTNLKRPSDAKCQVIGQPLSAGMKGKTGLRLCWTRECPHFLYDPGCKVDPADFAQPGTLVSFNGTAMVITLDTPQDAGWFRGGYVEWQASDEGTIERRMIEDDSVAGGNTTLAIFGLVDFIEIGDTVTCYPGCNRTPPVCDAKFNNIDNYGGFKDMPGASPFVKPIW